MSKVIDELSTHYDEEGSSSFADANGGSDAQRKVDGGQSAANSSRFTTTFLVMLGLSCVLVGIGAGIGAGYGIFNEEETPIVFQPEDLPEQWLVIVNSDNGTLSVSPDGVMRIDMNYLREQAPAFTNIPHRIATLTKMDTAFDFIEEGIERDQGGLIESRIARRALSLARPHAAPSHSRHALRATHVRSFRFPGVSAILSYLTVPDNVTHIIPLLLDQTPNVTGDGSASLSATITLAETDSPFEGVTGKMDEVNVFVISSSNPSSILDSRFPEFGNL